MLVSKHNTLRAASTRSWAFILFPSKPWVDWPLAIVFVAILAGFFITAEQALDEAWEFAAPDYMVYASIALWVMLLEEPCAEQLAAVFDRRAFSILPVVTEYMPGPLSGLPSTWAEAASYHLLSIESVWFTVSCLY